jgi:phage tail tape-measure protein
MSWAVAVLPSQLNAVFLPAARLNRDPLIGEPGAHPLGVGLGTAVGGAAAGATLGTAVGPVGMAVGVIAGGVAGAFAGWRLVEAVRPTAGQESDTLPPDTLTDKADEDYRTACQYGGDAWACHKGGRLEEVEDVLRDGW